MEEQSHVAKCLLWSCNSILWSHRKSRAGGKVGRRTRIPTYPVIHATPLTVS
uniref:Uncharacterized protein n=1 Tax=Rhizophora mucronata TaxID=61149 RepID=A0A2P2QYQ2_RHIMU